MSTSASGDRLATWLRRLRWPMVIAWVIAIVLLEPLASGLSKVTDDTASAYLPASAASTRVAELQQAAQHGPGQPETDTAVVLFTRGSGLTAADLATVRYGPGRRGRAGRPRPRAGRAGTRRAGRPTARPTRSPPTSPRRPAT